MIGSYYDEDVARINNMGRAMSGLALGGSVPKIKINNNIYTAETWRVRFIHDLSNALFKINFIHKIIFTNYLYFIQHVFQIDDFLGQKITY